MFPLALVIIGLLVVALAFPAVNFRFLLYPIFPNLNPMRNAKRVSLEGPTMFISDLHLIADSPFPYARNIRELLDARDVSNLVIVGDLFDSPEDARKIMSGEPNLAISNILGYGGLPVQVFFVQGSPPHDPNPSEVDVFNGTNVVRLGTCAILDFGRVTVVVYHGHDLSFKGALGHGWDRFISNLSLERAWKRLAGVPDSDWVIFGHTHIPGIDEKHRVANCGGWQTVRCLVQPARTGIFLQPESSSLEIVNLG